MLVLVLVLVLMLVLVLVLGHCVGSRQSNTWSSSSACTSEKYRWGRFFLHAHPMTIASWPKTMT